MRRLVKTPQTIIKEDAPVLRLTVDTPKYDDRGYLCDDTGRAIHRIVYERTHGKVRPYWHVHHIDYNKFNNDIDNLIAIPAPVHDWIHENFPRSAYPDRVVIEKARDEWLAGDVRKDAICQEVLKQLPDLGARQLKRVLKDARKLLEGFEARHQTRAKRSKKERKKNRVRPYMPKQRIRYGNL